MIWNKQIKLQLKMTYIGEYNSPIRNVYGGSEEDTGHCPSCENPDAISLCFAYFSSLVAAASSWHYILRLPGPAREKASFPTIVCWAWTNQVSDWMLGVDWLIPKTHTTSLSVIVLRRGVQTVWLMSVCGLAGESTPPDRKGGMRGRRWASMHRWMLISL